MRSWGGVSRILGFGSLMGAALFGLTIAIPGTAEAATTQTLTQRTHTAAPAQPVVSPARPAATRVAPTRNRQAATRPARPGAKQALNPKNGKPVLAARGGGLQCVPFARNASGIAISGNAWTWWDNAAGLYPRGNAPEEGAILSFRANGSMKLGHVAVVARLVNARQIEIDHANWAGPGGRKGAVTRGAMVVDVSDDNDWTAVRVALGRADAFGSIYPTNGFIYDRAETANVAIAAKAPAAPMLELGAAPRDLRPASERNSAASERNSGYLSVSYANGFVEVAEALAPRRTARARKPDRARR